MSYLSYSKPVVESSKVSRVITKRIEDMSPEEVLLAYQQNVPEDWEPTPEKKVIDAAYAMPIEELLDRANNQIKVEYTENRERYRTQNAITWQATPGAARYKATRDNAEKIIAALDEFGMEGSVFEMQTAFDHLYSQGKLELNPLQFDPKPVPTMREFSQLSLNEMESEIGRMAKDGIF